MDKRNLNKKIISLMIGTILFVACVFSGCTMDETKQTVEKDTKKDVKLTVLAAASLTDVCNELGEMYKEKEGVDLEFSYGSSGALQTQIEEGADCDLFMSAAKKQMDALVESKNVDADSVKNLLENKVVLVVPKDNPAKIESFDDVLSDKVSVIGLGDPESVPAGSYAKQVFTNLNTWEDVRKITNFGTDVRMVLSWVESGEVDCGVVYETDAKLSDEVSIAVYAPDGSCESIVYPVGIVNSSKNKEETKKFEDFLSSDEAMDVFEKYGFTKYE